MDGAEVRYGGATMRATTTTSRTGPGGGAIFLVSRDSILVSGFSCVSSLCVELNRKVSSIAPLVNGAITRNREKAIWRRRRIKSKGSATIPSATCIPDPRRKSTRPHTKRPKAVESGGQKYSCICKRS